MMQFVKNVNLSKLRNSEYCELMADTNNLLPGVLPSNPKVDELLAKFYGTYGRLDEVSSIDTGSIFTEKVRKADEERGNTWKGMDLLVEAYLHSPVEAQVESAVKIKRVFDVYGDFRSKPYAAESSDGRNLVQDLEKEENAEDCNRIKLTPWIGHYKTQLEEFKNLQRQRDAEQGEKSSGDVRAVRKEMDPIFRRVIEMVHSFMRVGMSTPEMEHFVMMMNQTVKRYNDMLAARKGRNKEIDSDTES